MRFLQDDYNGVCSAGVWWGCEAGFLPTVDFSTEDTDSTRSFDLLDSLRLQVANTF